MVREGNLFSLGTMVISTNNLLSVVSESQFNLQLWHKHLGLAGVKALQTMHKEGMALGFPKKFEDTIPLCEDCVVGKQHRKPFPTDGGLELLRFWD